MGLCCSRPQEESNLEINKNSNISMLIFSLCHHNYLNHITYEYKIKFDR